MKTCRQCGEIKPLGLFRKYYGTNKTGKPKGHYKMCKTCESVNMRYKYLNRKGSLNEAEVLEKQKIEKLYDVLRGRGLKPPQTTPSVMDLVDQLISKHDVPVSNTIPEELQKWLDESLEGMDPEELEVISDKLWETYRPKIGVDQETLEVIHDDTYREILLEIQNRFDTYEDEFYS